MVGLLVFFSASSALFACSSPDFLSFRAEPAKPFGREDAEKLASAQFDERYGACGTVSFEVTKAEIGSSYIVIDSWTGKKRHGMTTMRSLCLPVAALVER